MIIPTYGDILKAGAKQLLGKIIPYGAAAYAGYEVASIIDNNHPPSQGSTPVININHQVKENTNLSIITLVIVLLAILAAIVYISYRKYRANQSNSIREDDHAIEPLTKAEDLK